MYLVSDVSPLSSVQLLGLIRVIIEGIVESLVLVANDDVQDLLQSLSLLTSSDYCSVDLVLR